MISQADARFIPLADESVDCCITSPPYWGLRDYGLADGIGLEPTPEEYVENIVAVFREVWRVLKPEGTLWCNMGDCYNGSGGAGGDYNAGGLKDGQPRFPGRRIDSLKPKDLVGIPWRVAFALQADGWVLRSEIVWAKPNPMPESVRDRPTKAHEQLFLFAKARWTGPERGRYWPISDEDARWLALFLDTEGNLTVKHLVREGREWFGAQICFASTHRPILERARAIIGDGTILERPGTNAPMFYLQMSNRRARDLLYRVYPHLIVKPRQARLLIALQDRLSRTGKKRPGGFRSDEDTAFLRRCWETNKEFNHFGSPDDSWVPDVAYGRWVPERYYYDAEAIREPHTAGNTQRQLSPSKRKDETGMARTEAIYKIGEQRYLNPAGRNRRTIWTIPTWPYKGAHFATFPPALVEPCILAGTSAKGNCPVCGKPWDRVIERQSFGKKDYKGKHLATDPNAAGRRMLAGVRAAREAGGDHDNPFLPARMIGWRPTCDHDAEPVPAIVLDCFAGSGTVGEVCRLHGRRFVGLDLSMDYLRNLALVRAVGTQAAGANKDLPLFRGADQALE